MNNILNISNKLIRLFKILFFIVKKPRKTIKLLAKNINNKKDYETEKKEYLENKYGYCQLPTIDLLDLLPNFSETINNYSFLTGTSGIMDIALLKSLARRFDNCQYLEIGSWRGESIANVAEVATDCFSITLSDEEMRQKKWSEEFIKTHGFFSKALKNITHYYHNSATFDFSKLDKKFDLIFIDGDHSYEGVKVDTQNAWKLLRNKDSIIVWHDYGLNTEEVRYSVLSGILDGLPKDKHNKLFHVSNTICAIFINWKFKTKYIKFPEMPNKSFKIIVFSKLF